MTGIEIAPLLVGGVWVEGGGGSTFDVVDATTGEHLGTYPISDWSDVEAMLDAGAAAFEDLQRASWEDVAAFLERFADRLDARAEEICRTAERETALAYAPRLRDVELPRTTGQLRLAAAEARARRWTTPTLSPAARAASMLRPIPGPVAVFGPNNFPLAFNGVAGGDAAAALASGHPVIAKAHPLHAGTTRRLAEEAVAAAQETPGIPSAIVQLAYKTDHATGARLVADDRVAASAFTGSRRAGQALKAAADAAGKPIYVEMSSINPVVVLEGAIEERGAEVAALLAGSATAGGGQFCTKPGFVLALGEPAAVERFASDLAQAFRSAPCAPLLGRDVYEGLAADVGTVQEHGARVLASRAADEATGWRFPNTLLAVTAEEFLLDPIALQTELFGPASLLVTCKDSQQARACLDRLEGNLTGTIFSASDDRDEAAYEALEPALARRVGRLINDKVPTGVQVVAAMNHGGPFPATGHPGFTAIGVPASMRRFGMLLCYDNVRDDRLPPELQAANPLGLQRYVDGRWTDEPVRWPEP